MHLYDHEKKRYYSHDYLSGSESSEAISEKKIRVGGREVLVIQRRFHVHDEDPFTETVEDRTDYFHSVIGYWTGEGVHDGSRVSIVDVVIEQEQPEVIRTLNQCGITGFINFYTDKDF
jgi:hypothetical protein